MKILEIDLTDKNELINFLNKNSLVPSKRFGQNFLISTNALKKIILSANISEKDTIIEIGPGIGTLTKELIKTAKKVISLELDKKILSIIKPEFESVKNLEIIETDALKFTPAENSNYKIVANIPYYISSPILNHFLGQKNKPLSMTLLTQKEVAQKICDKKNESILSLEVKIFGRPKIVDTVKNTAFFPAPKVDSAILHIETFKPGEKDFIENQIAKKIMNLAKIGFSQKRKILLNTISKCLRINREDLKTIFIKLKIPEKSRPQNLEISDWNNLVIEMEKIKN